MPRRGTGLCERGRCATRGLPAIACGHARGRGGVGGCRNDEGPGIPGPSRIPSRGGYSIGWSSISWRAKRTGGAP